MKDFIQRNSPIFVIGAFTLFVFLIVIITSQFKKQKEPELMPLTDQQIKKIETPEQSTKNDFDKIDEKFGILEINYTQSGFDPKNAKAIMDQKVRWTNKTEQPIRIVQITKNFSEFKEGITIQPNETFEFRPYKPKLWSYKEETTELMGTIFVVDN